MEGHAKTNIADKVKCPDCLLYINQDADETVYCPVCEHLPYWRRSDGSREQL